ncbi:hypothetical protein CDO73_08380 [Saccharibacillus sp. O23]|nr:hypothetical protein CDO73_08380 [Saccharibacillus sp. O23]
MDFAKRCRSVPIALFGKERVVWTIEAENVDETHTFLLEQPFFAANVDVLHTISDKNSLNRLLRPKLLTKCTYFRKNADFSSKMLTFRTHSSGSYTFVRRAYGVNIGSQAEWNDRKLRIRRLTPEPAPA